jgi:hypothetical protein
MAESANDRIHKALFANMVVMLSSTAMQQLGKLINPETGKTETNLEAAQMTIDMLEMLRSKTRGNLDAGEERMLNEMLATLQLNYVDAVAAKPPQAAADKSPPPAPAPAEEPKPPTGETATEADAANAAAKDPKYHKSYG